MTADHNQKTGGGTSLPRLILNDDGSNFLYLRDNLTGTDLRQYLERYAETQVGMVAYCVAFGGGICYYNSAVGERLGSGYEVSHRLKAHRVARNEKALTEEVGDYIGYVFATLKALGLPRLASFRMNDCHMSSAPTSHVAGRFWMDHPEYRLDKAWGYYSGGMDYTFPAVRRFMRALITEVVQKFPDVDGLELDFMRSPFFFNPGEGRDRAEIITDFITEIRSLLDRVARADGRPRYLLTVNVPRSPEFCLEQGLDVPAWDALQLIDLVAAGPYAADMQIPVERWRDALAEGTPVYAYINCSPQMGTYLGREQYRAAAANAYGAGADGVYLFNLPCLDELCGLLPVPVDSAALPLPSFSGFRSLPDVNDTRLVFHELGDPDAVRAGDKHFLFYMQPPPYPHYPPGPVAIARENPEPAQLPFRCYEELDNAHTLELRVKAISCTANDDFEIFLNGEPITPPALTRLHSFRGRDARLHPIKLDPYSEFVAEPRPEQMRNGENLLEVHLKKAEPNLIGEIHVGELELIVRFAEPVP